MIGTIYIACLCGRSSFGIENSADFGAKAIQHLLLGFIPGQSSLSEAVSWPKPFHSCSIVLMQPARVMEDMRYLVGKYPDGYEGWARERGETPAPRPKEL